MNFDVEYGQTTRPPFKRWDGNLAEMRAYLANEWWESRQILVDEIDGKLKISRMGGPIMAERGQWLERKTLDVYDQKPETEVL